MGHSKGRRRGATKATKGEWLKEEVQEEPWGPKCGASATRAGQDPASPPPALPRVYGVAAGISEDSVV